MDENKKVLQGTQVALHSVRNILGEQNQVSFFSDQANSFSQEYGVRLEGKIERFGIDLTDMQYRMMEAVLRGFSETRYKGNIQPEDRNEIVNTKFCGKLPGAYKHIQEIPKLRATQSQILDWAGINKSSIASWARAVEAIQELGKKQYCFYYDRLVFNEKGIPEKESNGRWKKEEVVAVDTLFTIKEIREEKSGTLKYYEIMPSSIFLDQRESYFMLIPYNWREEVQEIVGKKKASSYTFRFILFLRYQFELKRRKNKNKDLYQIKWSPEEIAIAIKMPESLYKRKKKKADEILETAYSVAKKLGYLKEYTRTGFLDVLTLNEEKYFCNSMVLASEAPLDQTPEEGERKDSIQNALSNEILDAFYSLRQEIDPMIEPPKGASKTADLAEIKILLKDRSKEDILKLIKWSLHDKFWWSRLSSISKLRKNYSEAMGVMALSIPKEEILKQQQKKRDAELENYNLRHAYSREIQTGLWVYCRDKLKNAHLCPRANNTYIEFSDGQTCEKILYESKNFRVELEECLRKYGFSIPREVLDKIP